MGAQLNPAKRRPMEVAAAGGCSVLVTAMRNIERAMAQANVKASSTVDSLILTERLSTNNKWETVPEIKPTVWPPIRRRGRAVMVWGIEKTIKVLAPKAATITTCVTFSTKRRTTKKVARAKMLWTM